MNPCQRTTTRVLIIAFLASSFGTTGCTSMRPVRLVTGPGSPGFADIQTGDTVSLVSNGRKVRFVVGGIDSDSLTSTKGVRYQRTDVTDLKRRSRNWVKTGVLLAGVGFVTFVGVGIAVLTHGTD